MEKDLYNMLAALPPYVLGLEDSEDAISWLVLQGLCLRHRGALAPVGHRLDET